MLMAVIPAKSLDRAKQRLAEALPSAARRDLVCRMLERALLALAGAGVERRLVATRDPVLAALATRHGATAFDPGIENDLNAAATAAAAHATREGATSLLLVAAFALTPVVAIPFVVAGASADVAAAEAAGSGPAAKGDWGYPLAGTYTKGRGFGYGPVVGCSYCPAQHRGYDMAQGCGSTIYAAGPGRVITAGVYLDYGNTVRIDHGDGLVTIESSPGDRSLPAHLRSEMATGGLPRGCGTSG